MRLPGRVRRSGGAGDAVHRLEERVAQLEADLAFLRSKHEVLLEEGDRPRKENAVLRYDLQKCQRDRQVLDWHLNATRGELRMALALVRRYDGLPDTHGRALLEQAALLADEARGAGVDGAAVDTLADCVRRGWGETHPGESLPQAREGIALRAAHLLADLEAQNGDDDVAAAVREGEVDGEAWVPALREALRGMVVAIVDEPAGTGDIRSS